MREGWRRVSFSEFLTQIHRSELVSEMSEVPFAGARWYAGGIYHRDTVPAVDVKTKGLNRLRKGDVTYNRMWATKASFGIVHEDADGCLVTNDFPVFSVNEAVALTSYVEYLFHLPSFQAQASLAATGTTERRRLKERDFLALSVDLPPVEEQQRIVDLIGSLDDAIEAADAAAEATRAATNELRSDLLSAREGWTRVTIGDLASFDNGYPFKPTDLGPEGTPVIRIRQLLDPSVEPDRSNAVVKDSQKIEDGDLIFSWSATLAVRSWNRGPGLLNQHLFKVTPKDGVARGFVKECLELCIPNLHTHGTTMVHVTKKELLGHGAVLPPLDDQEEIAGTLKAAGDSISAAENLAKSLRLARSELLTVLLSGDHEIPESYDIDAALQLEPAA